MSKFNFQQRVLAGFTFTLVFVFVLAIASYLSIRELQKNSGGVYNTEQSITTSYEVLEDLLNCETAVRGYIVTGNSMFLEPYNLSVGKIPLSIEKLRGDFKNDIGLLQEVDSMEYYSQLKLAGLKDQIDLRNQNFEQARNIVSTGRGKMLMDHVRRINSRIKEKLTINSNQLKYLSDSSASQTNFVIISGSLIILILVIILMYFIIKTFRKQKLVEERVRHTNSQLLKISKENEDQNWLLTGTAKLDESMRGDQTVTSLSTTIIAEISDYVDAHVAAIYVSDDHDQSLHLTGSFAFEFRKGNHHVIKIGEGMVGQAALDKKPFVFNDVPADYVKVCSGLGEVTPHTILVQPFLFNGEVKGVIEFGFVNELTKLKMDFITMVLDSLGVAINTSQARLQMNYLLEETQKQAGELESQQEELRTTNDDLVNKTLALQASEEELKVQQEELRQINSELEEKAEQLEERNRSIEQAKEAIFLKAEELEQSSKFKSEFLANMSHELRTPLNSILILARILTENKPENLNEEQLKYSNVIYNAGSDLLELINDILDLSKIESGKIDLDIENVPLAAVKSNLELLFAEVANTKKINYSVKIAENVPSTLATDKMRLEQILKNLLSNAFKFTPHNGSVSVKVSMADSAKAFNTENLLLLNGAKILKFEVKDSGIGIPEDKQQVIFEAFQQADGSTSRKYGGTGLGLSISRELTNILGGEIQIESKTNEGSSFTLYLPAEFSKEYLKENGSVESLNIPYVAPVKINTEPAQFADPEKEHTMLIIEDDENFADVLKDYATQRGFIPLHANQGDIGLEMAVKHKPDAIILDIMLPVMDGWAVLAKLKDNPETKDIPVHMMSASDVKQFSAQHNGAIGFLKKPVEKIKLEEAFDKLILNDDFKLTKVLIIEDHEIQSENLRRQLTEHSVEVKQAFNGKQAMDALNFDTGFDCIILDINLPDISGLELLDKIKLDSRLEKIPVIINTAMELDKDSMSRVLKHTYAMVLKNNKSNERILDEVNLFMNKLKTPEAKPVSSPIVINSALTLEKSLLNKSVLIVDDDMRNIFALSSALQGYNMKIEIASNGIEALKKLDENPAINMVLMDIMMPEMDGYEAMKEIRKQDRFIQLPIMALTAKAMKNDREKCIEAGANDYITKPVDISKLVSMMRVWLS